MLDKNYISRLYITSILVILSSFTGSSFAQEVRELKHVSATECQGCHQDIYLQWSQSMHANSTALKDPIHGLLYKSVIGDPKHEGVKQKGKYPVCLKCHAPVAAKDSKTNLAAMPVYNEGINCVTCHAISGFKGVAKPEGGLRLGVDAYEFSETSLQGPGTNHTVNNWSHPAFPNAANPEIFKSNAICMGCHDQRKNSNKVPLCQTGSEIDSVDGSKDCLSCHMPVVNGKADHSFLGGHSAKMVSKGVLMTMTVAKNKNALEVAINITNKLPHNFPTGAPFRNVYIKLSAYDQQGKQVWASSQSHPAIDDKKAMFMYHLGDADGHASTPPKATQVLSDTRLKPHETRNLNYSLVKDGIVKLRAVAYYDLLLPKMKNKFSNSEYDDLTSSKIIAVTEKYID